MKEPSLSRPTWQKSSYCPEGNSCVHIAAPTPTSVLLTESGDPAATILTAAPNTFAALIAVLKKEPARG
ncbi:protein of unknown function DUF397 [Actinobacteria bacterium OK074]|nr:protein of unknown function DUF397 [Actinobacteria bacterium OK074]